MDVGHETAVISSAFVPKPYRRMQTPKKRKKMAQQEVGVGRETEGRPEIRSERITSPRGNRTEEIRVNHLPAVMRMSVSFVGRGENLSCVTEEHVPNPTI